MAKTEEKRGRGRPANFPGQETTARLYKLPGTTIALVEQEAERINKSLGITIDGLIQRGFNAVNRKRKTK